jgi:hypothetical protein
MRYEMCVNVHVHTSQKVQCTVIRSPLLTDYDTNCYVETSM